MHIRTTSASILRTGKECSKHIIDENRVKRIVQRNNVKKTCQEENVFRKTVSKNYLLGKYQDEVGLSMQIDRRPRKLKTDTQFTLHGSTQS